MYKYLWYDTMLPKDICDKICEELRASENKLQNASVVGKETELTEKLRDIYEKNKIAEPETLVGKATTDTLTNKTLTSPKINEDVVVSATATEINLLDGVTATTAELNFTDGVTSNIQTQLDAKAAKSFAIAQAVALG